jgi:hypothetical protein
VNQVAGATEVLTEAAMSFSGETENLQRYFIAVVFIRIDSTML